MININSIAFKNAIIYLLLFVVAISIVGVLMFRYSAHAILASAENDIVHRSELVEIKVNEYINGLNNDISYLAESPVLREYLRFPTPFNYALLSKDYLALLQSEKDFSQIRYIGVEDYGKERIRVDRRLDTCSIIELDALQSKGDRSYFIEAMKLESEDIYFSEINLNREFGKISIPHTPTLRVAKPIYDQGQKKGVIVINTNLEKLFAHLSNLAGEDYDLRIINKEGYFIMHEHKDSTFLFDIQTLATKPQVNNKRNIEYGKVVSDEDEIYVADHIRISEQYLLTQYVVAKKDYILASYYHWRNNSLLIIVLTSLTFMFLAFYILNKQAKRLGEITRGMLNFSERRMLSDLPTERNDEIGDLARSLDRMARVVNNQIDTVEEAKNNAEVAVREKSEFIENMSHEIRNPLQSIMGLTSMLESNNPNPIQLKLIQSLTFNTANLSSLVNNILDFQNVIKGDITLDYKWCNISHLVNEVVNSNKYAAVSKGIKLELNSLLDFQLEEYKIDQLRLFQILNNLLSNAIKYTQINGNVSVNVQVVEILEKEKVLRFNVEDTGVGLTPIEIQEIKKRYVTGGGASLLSSSFGLGLTIVNELLSYLQSELKVTSTKGKGSSFFFDLMMEYREDIQVSTTNILSQTILPVMDVLVVEDDLQILQLYKHFFSSSDANVNYCTDFPAFNDAITYDLIISDYRLDGVTLLTQIDNLLQWVKDDTPVIVVSATLPDFQLLSEHLQEVYYLRKPFQMYELQIMISKVLVLSSYGRPKFESILADYDYQELKYKHALGLMKVEWILMNNSLVKAVRNSDIESFNAILHKMITTLRRLELVGFEHWLTQMKSDLENEITIDSETIRTLENALHVYLQMIEEELNRSIRK